MKENVYDVARVEETFGLCMWVVVHCPVGL